MGGVALRCHLMYHRQGQASRRSSGVLQKKCLGSFVRQPRIRTCCREFRGFSPRLPRSPIHLTHSVNVSRLLSPSHFLGGAKRFGWSLEEESQYWIRVSDGLVSEQTAEVERLESFLSLPNTEKTQELCSSFLESPLDVFVSLSILRRDRLVTPLRVIASAEAIWKYLRDSPAALVGLRQRHLWLETAWLIAAIYRMLGRRTESREWLASQKLV